MDYARNTNQELIMVQLDLELMHTLGFGPHMSHLIFLLGQDAVSRY